MEAFVRHRDRKCLFDAEGRIVRRHVLVRRSKIVGLGKEANRIEAGRVLGQAAVGGRAKTYIDWQARLLGMGRAESHRLGLTWEFVKRTKRLLRAGTLKEAGAAVRRLKAALLAEPRD